MPHNSNHFCPYCLLATKQNFICGKCGQPMLQISSKARVPSPNASNKKWMEFIESQPYVKDMCPQTNALRDKGIDFKKLRNI